MGENQVTLGQKWRNLPRGQQNNKRITITHPTVAPPLPAASQGPLHHAVPRCRFSRRLAHSLNDTHPRKYRRSLCTALLVSISRRALYYTATKELRTKRCASRSTPVPMPGDAGVPSPDFARTLGRSSILLVRHTDVPARCVREESRPQFGISVSMSSRNDATYGGRNRRN